MDSEKLSDSASESDFFLPDSGRDRPSRRWPWPWIVSTTIPSLILLGLGFLLLRTDKFCKPQPLWRNSDFPASREIIEYEDVMFTGNGAIGKNGKFYVEHPSAVDYIGPPSQIVDDAWHNLTGERDFLITEGEAKELWPDNHETHWHFKKKGYSIGLDLFHTLHCLDSLRRYYYPEYYYGQTELDEDQVTHRGHCINQIRQYIMCAGDMTAYGTRYFKNPGRNYADSDVVHTCRNFGKLREWTRNRYHAGGALKLADVEVWNEWRKDETQY